MLSDLLLESMQSQLLPVVYLKEVMNIKIIREKCYNFFVICAKEKDQLGLITGGKYFWVGKAMTYTMCKRS